MPREVQPVRAVELGRTPLRKRAVPRLLVRERTRLPGRLGHGAVPIPLRVPRFPMVRGPGAGVVPADRAPLGDVPPEPRLGRRPPPRTRPALRPRDTAGAGRDQRASCPFRRPRSQASRFAPRTANRRLVLAPHAAHGPVDRTPAGRAHPVAETRPENATPVPSPSDDLLAGSKGAAGGHLATGPAGSPGEGSDRPGRRGLRPVGPRGPRWAPRPEPAPARGGRARARKTAVAFPNLTQDFRDRGGPRRGLRRDVDRRVRIRRVGPRGRVGGRGILRSPPCRTRSTLHGRTYAGIDATAGSW